MKEILDLYPKVLPNEDEKQILAKIKELPDEFQEELLVQLELEHECRQEVLDKLEKYRKVLSEISKDALYKLSLKTLYRGAIENNCHNLVREETRKSAVELFQQDIKLINEAHETKRSWTPCLRNNL